MHSIQQASFKQIASFYLSSVFAIVAANMFVYTLIILAQAISSSKILAGGLFFTYFIPASVLSFYAGAQVDRQSRKVILILYSLTHLITAGLCIYLLQHPASAPHARIWLFPIALVNGVSLSFAIPARFAILDSLLAPQQLDKGSIAVNLIMILSFGIAPFLVGGMLKEQSWENPLGLLAMFFFLSILLLIPVRAPKAQAKEHRILLEIKEGLQWVRRQTSIKYFFLVTAVAFFMLGPSQILMPEFAKSQLLLGEGARGLFMGSLGLGLLAGALFSLMVIRWPRRHPLLLMLFFGMGICFSAISLTHSPLLAALLLGSTGFFGGIIANVILSDLQLQIPNAKRGKVMGMFSMITQSMPAIGAGTIGLVAEQGGLLHAIQIAGFWCMGMSLFAASQLGKLRKTQ